MPTATRGRIRVRGLLTCGHNHKLGGLVHAFSIPAVRTCPGKTGRCARLCYADGGFFVMPSVADSHRANYRASLRDDFPAALRRAIDRSYARVVRIHVAGDFYAAGYVDKWIDVCRSRPEVAFFAYTRSWRVPAILPRLVELAGLANVRLWWSEDRETGPSPETPGVRVAYLVADALDEALVPGYADLAFRDRAHVRSAGRQKRLGPNVLVCPHEQGGDTLPLQCSQCRICFTPRAPKGGR